MRSIKKWKARLNIYGYIIKKRYSLQSDICAGRFLELNNCFTDIIIGTQVVDGTAVLSLVIPTDTSQEGDLHENSKQV